jgi:hypothetical protein
MPSEFDRLAAGRRTHQACSSENRKKSSVLVGRVCSGLGMRKGIPDLVIFHSGRIMGSRGEESRRNTLP